MISAQKHKFDITSKNRELLFVDPQSRKIRRWFRSLNLIEFFVFYLVVFFFFREKKVIDLEKPLLTGAFVDPTKVTQYSEKDYILPETPPFSWLIKNPKVSANDCQTGYLIREGSKNNN